VTATSAPSYPSRAQVDRLTLYWCVPCPKAGFINLIVIQGTKGETTLI